MRKVEETAVSRLPDFLIRTEKAQRQHTYFGLEDWVFPENVGSGYLLIMLAAYEANGVEANEEARIWHEALGM